MKNNIVIVTILTSCSLNGGIVRPVNTKQDGHCGYYSFSIRLGKNGFKFKMKPID